MPLHNWDADFTPRQAGPMPLPFGAKEIPAARQSSHAEGGRTTIAGAEHESYPYHLEEYLQQGFRALDTAMKHYFSGIRVPTKDSYRFMRVKVAGGDRSLLVWADELNEGRARLPVAAIDRNGHEFNVDKFSPPYHAMTARYLSSRGNLAAKVFRPVPYLVNYKLVIWTEHKRDMEYIMYQIWTRFNPIAEFRMFDGKIGGSVQLRYSGTTDASDKEAGFDQHAHVRYEVSVEAEAWLPLPEKIVPTVLGHTNILRERAGEILLAHLGQRWVEPVQRVE